MAIKHTDASDASREFLLARRCDNAHSFHRFVPDNWLLVDKATFENALVGARNVPETLICSSVRNEIEISGVYRNKRSATRALRKNLDDRQLAIYFEQSLFEDRKSVKR